MTPPPCPGAILAAGFLRRPRSSSPHDHPKPPWIRERLFRFRDIILRRTVLPGVASSQEVAMFDFDVVSDPEPQGPSSRPSGRQPGFGHFLPVVLTRIPPEAERAA